MLKAINRWRKARNTARELSALTDRELGDIGLTRADIYTVARQEAHTTYR